MTTMLSTYEKNFGPNSMMAVYVQEKVPAYLEPRGVVSVEEILPPPSLVAEYNHGAITERQYIRGYLSHLMKLDAKAFWDKYSQYTLLGQAKPYNGKLDNRFVVAEWLRMNGYDVKELEWAKKGASNAKN